MKTNSWLYVWTELNCDTYFFELGTELDAADRQGGFFVVKLKFYLSEDVNLHPIEQIYDFLNVMPY